MTKNTANKKLKKLTSTDVDSEFDVSIFEIRDRHYGSLLALKKKIRGCEKKIRELEQVEQQKLSDTKTGIQIESAALKKERLAKIEIKKSQLSVWKEAVMCIHTVRKEELSQGISNISMADISEGIELLKKVAEIGENWEFYKCPNKKHLQKFEIERIRNLASYLNVKSTSNDNLKSNFPSFLSVVDYLSSPIAIGQECPMSFTEFVRLFDKIRKTLTVEIVVKTPEIQQEMESAPVVSQSTITNVNNDEKGDNNRSSTDTTDNTVNSEKSVKTGKSRQPRNAKGTKHGKKPSNIPVNTATSVSGSQSLPSLPEKLVVVVTSNIKGKNSDEKSKVAPIVVSSDENSKPSSTIITNDLKDSKNENPKNLPPGRFIHNPNVPNDDDSDGEGWLAPDIKQKKTSSEYQKYPSQRGGLRRGFNRPAGANRSGNNRGGNNNFKRGSNTGRPSNFSNNKRTQQSVKTVTSTATTTVTATGISTKAPL